MRGKANDGTWKTVPDSYKNQEMCNKAVENFFFVFDSIFDQYKTQETCDRAVSADPFLIVYCPGKYIIQKMCDEAVDDSLATLKLIPDWFVASKMIEKIFTALYADENILYFNEDSGSVVYNCSEMGMYNIDLNNINLDNDFDEDDSDTIILIRRLA